VLTLNRAKRLWAVAAALFTVAASGDAAAAVEIRHDPIDCVAADRYAIIHAGGTPAERVAGAEIHFREGGEGGWYAVRMAAQGGRWMGVLPKPTRRVTRLEYRIVMTATDLSTIESAPVPVRVGTGESPCAPELQSSASVSAPIVVRAPAGAPVMPPVPAGFSPAGVVAAVQPEPRKSHLTAWIAGGAAAAAGIGAAVLGPGEDAPPLGPPEFTFFGSRPVAGATLSIRSALFLSVRASAPPFELLTFNWTIRFSSIGSDSDCSVVMSGGIVNASSTVPLQLTAPLVRSNSCRPPIRVSTGQLVITTDGAVVYDQTLELPFTFVD